MKLLAVVFCSLFSWQAFAAYEVSYEGKGDWLREHIEDAEGDVYSQLDMRLWGGGDSGGMDVELKASFGSSHIKDLSLKMEIEMQGDSCKMFSPGRWWGIPRTEGKCSAIDGDNKGIRVNFTKDNRVIEIDMEFKKDGGMLVSGSIERTDTDTCSDYCYVLWRATLTKEK